MITLLLVSIIATLSYILWKSDRGGKDPIGRKSPYRKIHTGLIIGILTSVALVYPEIKKRIQDMLQKRRH
jgi:hypothetical protein